MGLLITIVNTTISVLTLLVFIYSLLSFFLDPYHPIRVTLGRIIEPLLLPIRKIVPPISGLDFSPLILMILLQVVGSVLVGILRRLR
jgi:YggT family protein